MCQVRVRCVPVEGACVSGARVRRASVRAQGWVRGAARRGEERAPTSQALAHVPPPPSGSRVRPPTKRGRAQGQPWSLPGW